MDTDYNDYFVCTLLWPFDGVPKNFSTTLSPQSINSLLTLELNAVKSTAGWVIPNPRQPQIGGAPRQWDEDESIRTT